ncbi:MAG: late competence development ComFB family protein [Clostridiales bacterium]|jgi:competence protein ComFB|nr:late competence development ComFB family protein [Clostridiales bacterium]
MAKSKKELDKDLMFSKIMPALTSNPFSNIATPAPVIEENGTDVLSALREKLFARSSEYIESETIATINVMENLVLKKVDSVIGRFNVCTCDRCRCDICACALNDLPPHYIVAKPDIIAKAESEIPEKTVMDALIKAVIKVRAHPRH